MSHQQLGVEGRDLALQTQDSQLPLHGTRVSALPPRGVPSQGRRLISEVIKGVMR